jgi:protein gp88
MDLAEAHVITGGLSAPSKMPCKAYSLPAARCLIGQKLRHVAGSICGSCYALRGNYRFAQVQGVLERRYASLRDPRWVDAITMLIDADDRRHFRWHDSGDLHGVWHLKNIAEVARRLPSVRFWLPTREYEFVKKYLAVETKPRNLIIRLGAHLFDGAMPAALAKRLKVNVSGSHTKAFVVPKNVTVCDAMDRGNACGTCRACWDPKVFAVSYPKH